MMRSSLQESFLTPWLKNAHMATSWKQRLHLPASQGEPPSHRWCLALQAALVANTDTTPPGGESWDYGERWDKQAISRLENLHLQMIHLADTHIQSREDKQIITNCSPRLRLWQGQSDICSCYNDLKNIPITSILWGIIFIKRNHDQPPSWDTTSLLWKMFQTAMTTLLYVWRYTALSNPLCLLALRHKAILLFALTLHSCSVSMCVLRGTDATGLWKSKPISVSKSWGMALCIETCFNQADTLWQWQGLVHKGQDLDTLWQLDSHTWH